MFFSRGELTTLLYAMRTLSPVKYANIIEKIQLALDSQYKRTVFGGKGYDISYDIGKLQYKEMSEGKYISEFEGYRKSFIYIALGLPTYYPDSAKLGLSERLCIINQVFKDRGDKHSCTLFRESAHRIKKLLVQWDKKYLVNSNAPQEHAYVNQD